MTGMRRRNFLKGAFGVTVGLPFLEGLYTSDARAQDADLRFGVFIRQPTGVMHDFFWPSNEGKITKELLGDKTVSELASISSQLLIVRGMMFRDNYANSQGMGCHHAAGLAQLFTGTSARRMGAGQNNIQPFGESLDNRISESYQKSPLILYAHGTHDNRSMTSFGKGGELQKGTYLKPFAAYENMFQKQATPGAGDAKKLLRASALDYVRDELKELRASTLIGNEDRARLDAHYTLVRETEIKVATLTEAEVNSLKAKGSAEAAQNSNETMQTLIKLHMDIIALAVAAGGRKTASLQIGDIINAIAYNDKWPSQHENTHVGQTKDVIAAQVVYDRLHCQLFKYLVDKLNKQPGIGGKTLMDHGFIVMGSEIGTGPAHSFVDIPILIAGSANGYLKQGEYVNIAGGFRNSKLLNTLGSAMGVKNAAGTDLMDDFGDSSEYTLKEGNNVVSSGKTADFKGRLDRIIA